MTDKISHDGYIKQGIEDYKNTFGDWELGHMIDEIIVLSNLKAEIEKLIQSMKQDLVNTYEEKKK